MRELVDAELTLLDGSKFRTGRTAHGKTWELGRRKDGQPGVQVMREVSTGLIHVPDNVQEWSQGKPFKWLDVDRTFDESTKEVKRVWYQMRILDDGIGYEYFSKRSGHVICRLEGINTLGLDFSKLELRQEGHEYRWVDVVPGVDIWIACTASKVQVFKEVKKAVGPLELRWKVWEPSGRRGIDHFCEVNYVTRGWASDRRGVEIQHADRGTKIDSGRVVRSVSEIITGRVYRRDRKTRSKVYSLDPHFPLLVDQDTGEIEIAAASDDGFEYQSPGGSWYNIYNGGVSFYSTAYNDAPAFRWINTGVPQQTLDAATFRWRVRSGTGSSAPLFGRKEVDAATWGSGNLPSSMTPTTASATWTTGGVGTNGTLDVLAIVQEIVNQQGWPGNDEVIALAVIDGTDGTGACVVDDSESIGVDTNPATLQVTWTVGGGGEELAIPIAYHYRRMFGMS